MWVLENFSPASFSTCGVDVLHRTDSNYDDVKNRIVEALRDLIVAGPSTTEQIRKAAAETAAQAQWSTFIAPYDTAYCQALSNRDSRTLK